MKKLLCTRGRDRTGTSVTSLVFETSASTNSATRAKHFVNGGAKVINKLKCQKKVSNFCFDN